MGTYSKLTYHIIFATKYRRKQITDELRSRLYEYIGGTIRGFNGHLITIGGIEDHVHLLTNLPAAISVSKSVQEIKACSSKWVNETFSSTEKFHWQIGYGAFTVSHSMTGAVNEYIQNQVEHHRIKTFEEEYVEFLNKHGIPFEHRDLFDDEHQG